MMRIGTIQKSFQRCCNNIHCHHHYHRAIRKVGKLSKGNCYFYSVYAWGTSVHDSIPNVVPSNANESTTQTSSSSSSSSTASSLLSSSKTVFDHPKYIDVKSLLNLDTNNNNVNVTVQEFTCGKDKSAIILSDGSCYTWGQNDHGQLGLGHADNTSTPSLIDLSSSSSSSSASSSSSLSASAIPFSSIALHTVFSACISADMGDLYTFGSNGSAFKGGMGYLGHGYDDENSYYTPKLVESLVEDGCTVSQVSVGESHMCVLTTEGEVLTAGSGSYGRLGNLESTDQLYLEPVELLAGEDICQVDVGNSYTLALTKDGVLHAWGRNDKGQLGDGGGLMVDMYAMENLPRPIEGQLEGRMVVKVSTGYAHAACVTDKGELFFWGMGQVLEPTLISSMLHKKCVDVECGRDYTLVLTEEGELYSFGKGKTGVLGHANTNSLSQPELVEALLGKKVVKMSAGCTHCAVLVEDDE